MSRVQIGTAGWDFPGWEETYYPEDIPADWKLAFYANDFSAVVLPEKLWKNGGITMLKELLEDVDNSFAVYCLVESRMPSADDVRQTKQYLGGFFKGFIVETGVRIAAGEALLQSDFIVSAEAGVSAPDKKRLWTDLSDPSAAKVSVLKITAPAELKTLRRQLESVRNQLDYSEDVLVLVAYESPEIEFLQQLHTLLELMAIA